MSLSIILVTSGRPTLTRTLESIAAQKPVLGDEVLVVGNSPFIKEEASRFGARYIVDGPFGNFGQVERQNAMRHARGTHLLFIDDDDFYLPWAFHSIRSAIKLYPNHPMMFRMLAPSGLTLWIDRNVWVGNVSGTQFVVPNQQHKLGVWGLSHEGDYDFIVSTMRNFRCPMLWSTDVIVGCRDQGIPAGA